MVSEVSEFEFKNSGQIFLQIFESILFLFPGFWLKKKIPCLPEQNDSSLNVRSRGVLVLWMAGIHFYVTDF